MTGATEPAAVAARLSAALKAGIQGQDAAILPAGLVETITIFLDASAQMIAGAMGAQQLADALAAVTADRDAQRDRADRAERERDEAVELAVAVAITATRRATLEEAARLLDPSVPRPCNCEHCDCGNPGDHAYVVAWDEAKANADMIRAALAARTGGRTDGE